MISYGHCENNSEFILQTPVLGSEAIFNDDNSFGPITKAPAFSNFSVSICDSLKAHLTTSGQFLPNPLPEGCLNNVYSQTIAFNLKKDTVLIFPSIGAVTIPVDSAFITGINILPPGILFTGCNSAGCRYIPASESKGCLTIDGTPNAVYNDSIEIIIEYWVGLFGSPQAIKDTVKLPLKITSCNASVCSISSASFTNVGSCNDNGTPNNSADDFYTANLSVNFTNPPATGMLRIKPGNTNVLDVVEIPVASLVGSSHTFTGVRLRTTGTAFGVDVEFSADISCVKSLNASAVSSCSASSCAALQALLTTPGQFLPNPLPEGCTNNAYSQTIAFNLKKDTALVIPTIGPLTVPVDSAFITGINNLPAGILFTGCNAAGCRYIPFNESLGCLTIDGTPAAVYNDSIEIIVDYWVGILGNVLVFKDTVKLPLKINSCNPSTCSISGASFTNVGSCNDNGTPGNTADDFYTANLSVNFTNPPATGMLRIKPGNTNVLDIVEIPVASLVGSSHTFTGVRLRTTGAAFGVDVEFSADISCVKSLNASAVGSCSASACSITGVTLNNVGACNDNGTSNASDDYFIADVVVNFTNPPPTGTLRIKPGNTNVLDVVEIPVASLVGSSHTFTGVRLRTTGNVFGVDVEFSANISCVKTVNAPSVSSCSVSSCAALQALLTTPGQFLPNPLPEGCMNNAYSQTIAFNLKKDTALVISTIGPLTVPVDSAFITGINNLPTGILFTGCNSAGCRYIPASESKGCLTIDGTPNAVYNDSIEIIIEYWVGLLGSPQAIKDTVKLPLKITSCNASVCSINSVSFSNVSSCNDNGTSTPSDDYFVADVVVNFINPPATGNLQIVPGGDAIGTNSIAANSLVGNSHTFTGVHFKADGTVTMVSLEFTTPANQCIKTQAGPTIQPCSATCVITCPSNIIVSNTINQCGVIVNYTSPNIIGTCGNVTSLPSSGSFFPVGITTVTSTASNGSTCSFTVKVNDTQPPVISCPVNIVIKNELNQCGAVVNFTVTANDNCPGVTINSNPASGSFFPVGTTTVTSTATDASGNMATCTFTVKVNDLQPPVITCPQNITLQNNPNQCNAIVNFTVSASDNCSGVTIQSNPVSGSLFPVGTTTVVSTATDASGNTSTCTFTVTVNATIAKPQDIFGPIAVCCGQNNVKYCIDPLLNATSYVWTLPVGVTGFSTGTCITVNFSNSYNGGAISVKGKSACGMGQDKGLNISKATSLPSTPGVICGPPQLCQNICNIYSITSVSGATSYLWSATGGLTINSGQGTNTITVCAPSGFITGNISVKAINCKGNSGTRTININSIPRVPVWKNSGGDNIIVGACANSTIAYEIEGIPGINEFVWYAPSNAIIYDRRGHSGNPLTVTGTDPVEGEWEVDIKFPTGFVSGNVSVAAQNTCGKGPVATLAVKSKPSIPGPILGISSVCKNSTVCYSISSIPGATSYTWVPTGGATIFSGQGTINVCVKFNSAISNSTTLTVKANNVCGPSAGSSKVIAVKLNCKTLPGDKEEGELTEGILSSLIVFPNPASDKVILNFTSDREAKFSLKIIDLIGKILITENILAIEGQNMNEINLKNAPKGIYFLLLQNENTEIGVTRILVE